MLPNLPTHFELNKSIYLYFWVSNQPRVEKQLSILLHFLHLAVFKCVQLKMRKMTSYIQIRTTTPKCVEKANRSMQGQVSEHASNFQNGNYFIHNSTGIILVFLKMKKLRSLYDSLPERVRVMAHYVYPKESRENIEVEHFEPGQLRDRIAYKSIRAIRRIYDYLTAYNADNMTVAKWIRRCILLETVAGVPGMVGGMARHLKSIRDLRRDKGWIHHLLEQADNERFHLFIFLKLKEPGYLQRLFILAMQGTFFNLLFISYLMSPKFSHRFVGYLQEEAVKTYTAMLADINSPHGVLHEWSKIRAPIQCRDYYELDEDATLRDVIVCIRADQACHRGTNHYLASEDQHVEIEQEDVKVINKRNKIHKEEQEEQEELRKKIEQEMRKERQSQDSK